MRLYEKTHFIARSKFGNPKCLYSLVWKIYINFAHTFQSSLDENQFRNFVIWLEDKVIRQYEVKDRYLLRETSDSEWNKYFAMVNPLFSVFSKYFCSWALLGKKKVFFSFITAIIFYDDEEPDS